MMKYEKEYGRECVIIILILFGFIIVCRMKWYNQIRVEVFSSNMKILKPAVLLC